jgi:hypothetical protein
VYVTATVSAALVAGSSRARTIGGIALSVPALASPLLLPETPSLLRFTIAMGGLLVFFRAVDLARDRRRHGPRTRLWLFTALVDVREARREPVCATRRTLASGVAHVVLGALGATLIVAWGRDTGEMPNTLMRVLGGVILVYGIHGATGDFLTAAYASAGIRIPEQYRPPILARSVGAFWSRHYNLNVSRWLASNVQRPIVRAGRPRWGTPAAFAVSALFHAWLLWVTLEDLEATLYFALFFVLMGVFAALEIPLRVNGWPRAAQHVWTSGVLVAASPLFLDPFLRILGL